MKIGDVVRFKPNGRLMRIVNIRFDYGYDDIRYICRYRDKKLKSRQIREKLFFKHEIKLVKEV